VPTFSDRGCRLISVTDPYSRVLGFLDKEKTETLIETNKEVGLVVIMEKTRYCMSLYDHQNAGQAHDMLIGNKSFGNILNIWE
jgi:hypothetical protein